MSAITTTTDTKKTESSSTELALCESPMAAYVRKISRNGTRFALITTQIHALIALMSCIYRIARTAHIVISAADDDGGQGLVLTAVSDARTNMIRWVLRAEDVLDGFFISPKRSVSVTFDIGHFLPLLSAVHGAQCVCLYFDDDEQPSELILEGKEDTCEYRMRTKLMIDTGEDLSLLSQFSYTNCLAMEASALDSRVKHMGAFDTVQLHLTADTFSMKAVNDMTSQYIAWPLATQKYEVVFSDNVVSPQTVQLPIIHHIMRITKATKFVKISMPERGGPNPIHFGYALAALGNVSFFVCPLCDTDELDQYYAMSDDDDEEAVPADDAVCL